MALQRYNITPSQYLKMGESERMFLIASFEVEREEEDKAAAKAAQDRK